MNTKPLKTKILVDGDCIVCDVEVSHYKRMAPDLFELVDISQENFKATEYGLSQEEVQKNLHVITPEGERLIGVDAFAHIWSRIDRYHIPSKLIKLPLVNPIAKMGYKTFTVLRPFLPRRR